MFSQPITYNGLTINSGQGLSIGAGSVGGLTSGHLINSMQFSDITTQEYLQKRALQDGFFAADVYLGGRTVTIDASIYGTSRAQTYDLLQAWTGAFSPRIAYNADTANVGFLPFTFYQPTDNITVWDRPTYPKGIPMQVYLRPMKPVHYDLVNNGGPDPKRGWSIRTLTTLFARDPRKYLQTQQTNQLISAGSASNNILTYRGDYPSFPVLNGTITSAIGTSAAAITIATVFPTTSISLNLSTYVGTFSVDYATHLMSDGSGNQVNGLLNTGSTFTEVHAGTGVGGNLAGNSPLTSMTLTYREAFT